MSKRKDKKKHKADQYYDPPIWVEGHKLNEVTGKMESIKYKLKKKG